MAKRFFPYGYVSFNLVLMNANLLQRDCQVILSLESTNVAKLVS
jgi:hypothetical protein